MNRQPDSRAGLGQRLEDEDDAITEGIRLQTREWIVRLRRGNPRSERHRSAIIAGIAGGLLDELWDISQDPDKVAGVWDTFSAAYLDRGAEDAAADAEPLTTPIKGGDDA